MATERLSTARQVCVLVLAGGASERMGLDKALVEIAGETMLSRVVGATSHLGPVTVVGGQPDICDHLSVDGATTIGHIRDEVPGAGPFAALATAVALVDAAEALVVSCDLAHPTTTHFDQLIAARRVGDADIALPLVGGQRQWHAVAFATRIIPTLTTAHLDGVRSLQRGFRGCSETVVCSSSSTFFSDVDTPEELEALRTLVN